MKAYREEMEKIGNIYQTHGEETRKKKQSLSNNSYAFSYPEKFTHINKGRPSNVFLLNKTWHQSKYKIRTLLNKPGPTC